MRKLGWIVLGTLLACSTARADETGDERCAAATTTAEMRACEGRRRQAAEAAMTAAYGTLESRFGKRRKALLRRSQRAWLQYRDATAELYASAAEGGTLAPMLRVSALADLTEARASELSRLGDGAPAR